MTRKLLAATEVSPENRLNYSGFLPGFARISRETLLPLAAAAVFPSSPNRKNRMGREHDRAGKNAEKKELRRGGEIFYWYPTGANPVRPKP